MFQSCVPCFGKYQISYIALMLCVFTFVLFAENWVILGIFYYPALYYPLLACGTLHNKVGYVLGSLLSWTHFGVLVWQKIDCPRTPLVWDSERFMKIFYIIIGLIGTFLSSVWVVSLSHSLKLVWSKRCDLKRWISGFTQEFVDSWLTLPYPRLSARSILFRFSVHECLRLKTICSPVCWT